MPRLYMITVPGLNVKLDWAAVHDRLLDDFPHVSDVLATTIAATLLIVYEGEADIDDWLAGVSDGILSRRISAAARTRGNSNAPLRARADLHQPDRSEFGATPLIYDSTKVTRRSRWTSRRQAGRCIQ